MLGSDDLVFCSAPAGEVPLLDRLAPVRRAGFAGLSILPTDVWRLEEAGMPAAEIRTRVEDSGLEIAEMDCVACWLPGHERQGDGGEMSRLLRSLEARRVVETAARIGARSVAAVELSGVAPSVDAAAEAFARLCDIAAEHGLRAHIEFLPAGGVPDLATAAAIVEAAGRANGGLTLDAWHFFRSGSRLAELSALQGERICAVQLCDGPARPTADPMTEMMTARRLPGDGDFDLRGLIATLEQIGCAAPMGVEVFDMTRQRQPLDERAQSWADAARKVLGQARGGARA